MDASHIHLGVQDLAQALDWFKQVWDVKPSFQNEGMAVVPFGSIALVLDAADEDSAATIAFQSGNCDKDYGWVIERGAISLEEPSDRSWGVRVAYIKGPGALTFEIEQPLDSGGK